MKHSEQSQAPVAAVSVAGESFAADDLALDAQRGRAIERARAFAEPLIASETLDTGENILAHADAVAAILRSIGGSEAMQSASYLVYACEHLNKPEDVITKAFGASYATLAMETTRLVHIQRHARAASLQTQITPGAANQTENIRKMLLAFSRDLRVVMLRLASRLQTLRHYAAIKSAAPRAVSSEALHVFAPLANRLGIWQIKWEMEDLAFRFLEPDTYKAIAKQLDEKRTERESGMQRLRETLQADLIAQGIAAQVQGRPKHIYSIVKKMRGKQLGFDQVLDVRAMRVIVQDAAACYAALSRVHELYAPMDGEFDDYIAKPKSNGYQSLHTVVRDDTSRPLEIQIRTEAMHQHAETGVAAHWAYKEAGTKGYAGVSANVNTKGSYDAKIAVLRQLLAWQQDVSGEATSTNVLDDRIYVLTPDAAIVDLPRGATPVDFAYAVHTNLGHRCRGARVNGQMVTLNTPLANGQTVEINAAKEGGPSRDWLNPELHFLASPRAKAKVRAWFNALQLEETIASGRQAVEKLLQREGKTALKFDDLAAQLGFKTAEALFEVVGKDEFSLRTIEQFLRPAAPEAISEDEQALLRTQRVAEKISAKSGSGSVLVVGVDSLLTQLAKCCKPAPPDAIVGYVTRGKGVSIHRAGCSTLRSLVQKEGERLVDVAWGASQSGASYAVDARIVGSERHGLLRDITEVFSKEKLPVRGVQQNSSQGSTWITLTVVVSDAAQLTKVLAAVAQVQGVETARRI
ncbi:bifunctional (p)ppGpp synthetase/guanosine-3',5'-bis(diphosphate) 3'-pyrophosphohydrolase [Variovorax sp. PCZ-1]|uniref:RelA/SpoT family protein n=1 Tax=Variovorax sp. PCZ-1 TaxID=2835533 RepID=UPI001BD05FC6|nr:bifunctional (p)ppGpp synthetase/guanosine-3',5'-bis(diphosphate) 3'-pyrophosphohydrolase [Variovorax sp. PCZ-1]MBS7807821.1 bifunctional (p)ppGpp synthetase/guanosine-3',5'-bis(diphosphate) 3'-pyrophosphohydrolase [Variovorax sp. PCZ-1]